MKAYERHKAGVKMKLTKQLTDKQKEVFDKRYRELIPRPAFHRLSTPQRKVWYTEKEIAEHMSKRR